MSDIFRLGNVSLRQLRAFVSVAEAGSFTAAAVGLRITQSAISALIRDLEIELGLQVFDRTTRAVRLTEPGQELLPTARRLLIDLQAAITSSRELATKKRGRVRIAATPLFCSLFLPEIILDYRMHFPGVEIIVRDRAAGSIATLVDDGEVDLGIGTPPMDDLSLDIDSLIPAPRANKATSHYMGHSQRLALYRRCAREWNAPNRRYGEFGRGRRAQASLRSRLGLDSSRDGECRTRRRPCHRACSATFRPI
jgi:DNA-binding transcriptional LysR family regulator